MIRTILLATFVAFAFSEPDPVTACYKYVNGPGEVLYKIALVELRMMVCEPGLNATYGIVPYTDDDNGHQEAMLDIICIPEEPAENTVAYDNQELENCRGTEGGDVFAGLEFDPTFLDVADRRRRMLRLI